MLPFGRMDQRPHSQAVEPQDDRLAVDFPEDVATAPASPRFLLGHDDEAETLVAPRAAIFGVEESVAEPDSEGSHLLRVRKTKRVEPPPLPIALVRRKDAWVQELPPAARRVLEEAQALRPSWPLRPRVEGSVARPRQKIPSLARAR